MNGAEHHADVAAGAAVIGSSPDRPPSFVRGAGDARVHLTLAISEYEHVRDLTSGLIRPAGIALNTLVLPIEELAYRYFKNLEFDVAESSFAKFITLTAAADPPIVGIPVFPARLFRHSAIYVRTDRGIAAPRDLEGKTVGLPEWAQTAGVYVRGMLADQYGLALDKVRWVQAGVNESGRTEKVRFELPAHYHYEARSEASISDMLVSGEIDAAITAKPPASFIDARAPVARLFPDFQRVEQDYFDATGIFPIMHLVSMRRAVFDACPWVARSLQTAFGAAKDAAVARAREITTSRLPLPWGAAFAAEMTEKMGGDLWPYGVEANRATLDSFCRYAHQQFLTPSLLSADDLFPAEVLADARV